jgi:hypothetical protein
MDKQFPYRFLPLTALGVALGFSGALPAFVAALALLVTITYWLQPFANEGKVPTDEIINRIVRWLGGWKESRLCFLGRNIRSVRCYFSTRSCTP